MKITSSMFPVIRKKDQSLRPGCPSCRLVWDSVQHLALRALLPAVIPFLLAIPAIGQKGFVLINKASNKKIEVRYDGRLLTAYCYFDSTEKPILFPLKTVSGVTVTRGYPIVPHAGERTDHPHHVGMWLNYGNVNGLDFWNNSFAIPADKKPEYGSIHHKKILSTSAKGDNASIETVSDWVDHTGKVLLEEHTRFVFLKQANDFIIDRLTTLEAKVPEVIFKDNKEGMIGMRVARELEMPSNQPSQFVDAHGKVTTVTNPDGADATGMYVNAEGVKGDDVWSSRSRWACLNGTKDGENISVAIIDHPSNVGYPTYWHARGYGLFAANPLGQEIFSDGKHVLNFTLKQGQKTTFRYRTIIHSGGTLTADDLNKQADQFAKQE